MKDFTEFKLTPVVTNRLYDVTVADADHELIIRHDRALDPNLKYWEIHTHPGSLQSLLEQIPGVQVAGYDDAGDPRISYKVEIEFDTTETHAKICEVIAEHIRKARKLALSTVDNTSPN